MELTKQRELIFESEYSRIVDEGKSCYRNDEEFEDLLQILLIGYRVALKKADLALNYHAYCMKYAHWDCFKELNKRKKRKSYQSQLTSLSESCKEEDTIFFKVCTTTLEDQVTFETHLSKLAMLYEQLKPSERSVIDERIFGFCTGIIKVKTRRQQMIVSALRKELKESIDAA